MVSYSFEIKNPRITQSITWNPPAKRTKIMELSPLSCQGSDLALRSLLKHRHKSHFTKASEALNSLIPCQGIHPPWQGQSKMQNTVSIPTVHCLRFFQKLLLGCPVEWQQLTVYQKGDSIHGTWGPCWPPHPIPEAIFQSHKLLF